jgi:hypothetical protein
MNAKITLILAIVFALAITAFLLTQGDESLTDGTGTPDSNQGDTDARPLISSEVLGIDLKRIIFDGGLQGTLLQLERIDGRWWVTTPNRFAAKTTAVDELLNQLSEMKGRPAKEDESGGLVPDSPGLLLEHGDEETGLWFSSRLGAGRAIVTLVRGDTFEDVNTTDALIDLFDSFNPDTFYSDRFNAPLMPEVGRIEINTPEGQSVLVQEDGRWWIEHDQGRERALETGLPGYPGVNNYFNLLKTTKLIEKQTSYPTNGLALFGLQNPLISARFVPIGQDHEDPNNGYEVHVGTPAGPQDLTRYISNGTGGKATHPVFTADTQSALAFAQDAKAFRDPRVMTVPRSLIGSMAIRNLKGHYTIRFMSNGIQLVTSGVDGKTTVSPKETRSGEKLAFALSNARAIDYVDRDQNQLKELTSVTITPRLEGSPETIVIYRDKTDETVLIKTDDEPKLRQVERASVQMLLDTNFLESAP